MFAKHCVRTLMVALLVCGGTACGSDGGTSTQKSSSCARFFTFEGREYRDVGDFPVEAGKRVGTAVQPACDQHGADGEKRGPDKAAYEVKGVTADVAIAVGDDPDDVEIFVSYDGTKLPRRCRGSRTPRGRRNAVRSPGSRWPAPGWISTRRLWPSRERRIEAVIPERKDQAANRKKKGREGGPRQVEDGCTGSERDAVTAYARRKWLPTIDTKPRNRTSIPHASSKTSSRRSYASFGRRAPSHGRESAVRGG